MITPNANNKKKNPVPGIVFAIVLLALITAAENSGSIAAVFVLFTLVFCAAVVIAAVRKAKKQQKPGETDKPLRSYTTHEDVPDAHCVVCENTGDDHFARDKARRIAQLDDFLKNGIIDKAEYRKLRERFENDI